MNWCGDPPEKCDLCGGKLRDSFVDGVVAEVRSWAIMCMPCHRAEGVGLGPGLGQRYALQKDGTWLKTAG